MVNKSTKEGEKKATAEENVPSSGSDDSEVINKAGEEAALQPQEVKPDEKSHGDAEPEAEQVTIDAKTSSDKPAKKSRGRPKKGDGSAPPVKKAKKEKERPSPARTSARVKNQRAGVKLENTEELPERKRSSPGKGPPAKKVAKNGVEQNGTAVEA